MKRMRAHAGWKIYKLLPYVVRERSRFLEQARADWDHTFAWLLILDIPHNERLWLRVRRRTGLIRSDYGYGSWLLNPFPIAEEQEQFVRERALGYLKE